ncbi:MAG: rhodanese-like domain-containing protein [bacterium]|nr:rhodanese-like domain-containing protein [bacterium]
MDHEITVIEAFELIHSADNLRLVDLRSKEAFAKKSINGFSNVPFADLSNELGGFDNRKKTLLLCEDGTKSHQALQLLEACGYSATVIRGGIKDWLAVIEGVS